MTDKNPLQRLSLQDETTEFLLYTAPNGQVKVEVILHNETLWLTQKRMAELFGVGVPAVSKHLKNIFESKELEEEVVVSILENTTEHERLKNGPYLVKATHSIKSASKSAVLNLSK